MGGWERPRVGSRGEGGVGGKEGMRGIVVAAIWE